MYGNATGLPPDSQSEINFAHLTGQVLCSAFFNSFQQTQVDGEKSHLFERLSLFHV
jgi:hypothetical protein